MDRRKFILGGLGALLATYGVLKLGSSPSETAPATQDKDASDLAARVLHLIQNKQISNGYRPDFLAYQDVIDAARDFSQKKDLNDPRRLDYSSLEVIALMYQARLIREAGNNIIAGEEIKVAGLPVMQPRLSLSSPDISYNQFKALENYERVMQIHEEIENQGGKLPERIGYRLGDYGLVATRDFVNEKMFEVVEKLMQLDVPAQYKDRLSKRGYELSSLVSNLRTQ